MDVKETAKQIREFLLLLLEGGFVMPIILTSIDRYGSLMVAEYTPIPGERDHWHCNGQRSQRLRGYRPADVRWKSNISGSLELAQPSVRCSQPSLNDPKEIADGTNA
jgi:hypothetical protein